MNIAEQWNQLKQQASLHWRARTDQERMFLRAGFAVVLLALAYALFVAPAQDGRARLGEDLPQLRQQAAQMRGLAAEAAELARQPAAPPVAMTRESLAASLAARGMKAQSLTLTGDYAKLQLTGVPFASLASWLDAQRRESRVTVREANVVAQAGAGLVDATLTLQARTEVQ